MACTERSRWRWRSLPEAQPAVGIVWMVNMRTLVSETLKT